MEGLWKLEEKWKVTTQKALVLLVCSAFAVIGVCIVTILKRNRNAQQRKQMVNQEEEARGDHAHGCFFAWLSLTKWRMLMASVRWSSGNKRFAPPQPPLLGLESRSSLSPVWQRPILMGEKCELPMFSGLILYDDKGRLLRQSLSPSRNHNIHQEKAASVIRTTLKDLL